MRLERLGDVVNDYLATNHAYYTTAADPGQLTDNRSALVNNNYSTSLLTDALLDKHILHSARVHGKVLDYLKDRWWDHDQEGGAWGLESNPRLYNEIEPVRAGYD